MIDFVVPMAGRGERFRQAGFDVPKFLVASRGKSLLEHALGSLPIARGDRVILIALEEHARRYDLARAVAGLPGSEDFVFRLIPEVTRGQAETVLRAADLLDGDRDLVIYNADTAFRSGTLRRVLETPALKGDGVLGAFRSREGETCWSFARTDAPGRVLETAEKTRISDLALTGLYHFTRGADFLRVAQRHVAAGRTSKNEFYIAPMYNDLISEGKRFVLDLVEEFIPLGTPADVAAHGKGA